MKGGKRTALGYRKVIRQVGAGTGSPLHHHPAAEDLLVIAGYWEVVVGDDKRILHPDSDLLLHIEANVPHRVTLLSEKGIICVLGGPGYCEGDVVKLEG